MKINYRELVEYSSGEATIEGRLHHKRITGSFSQSGFKERWFKLRANILFYFNSIETGKAYEKKPSGAFILENATVRYEVNSEAPFSFSILFHDDFDKKHLFSGMTEGYINEWIYFLKQASYEFWRSRLIMLQTKLYMLTGKDPLLMYPRNEGSTSQRPVRGDNTSPKPKKQSPTFRSYVTAEEDVPCRKPVEVPTANLLKLSEEPFFNGLDQIGKDLKDVRIDFEPPKRPARANKAKADAAGVNLIDL